MRNILLKLFISFLTGLFLQSIVCASEIKFVQVSDTHYGKSNPYSERVLKAAVEDINGLNGVSFVVFTGDNIDKPQRDDLERFVKIVNKLNVPYYLIIGNHDVFKSNGLSKKDYWEIVNTANILYKYDTNNYAFSKGDFAFIAVDGAKEVIPGTVGYYKEDTLAWLEKKLKKYHKKSVIIMQHFPLLSLSNSKSHKTYRSEEYLEMLKRYPNVKALVAGHYHLNNEQMQDGIYHITSPSLLVQPNQYKIIDIITTKGFSPMIYTQLRDVNVK